ncbi:ABC transporter ATP-binding protein [Microbacterium halophytorum]|uniref:ABC transporter ATP-binding protein n=1 Tax=Microbacterium halophytorum TaxID=2067568 RepID=UPI000CFCE7F8|nr:ABC transporter ATP-binding protein [Microbacterium halophytorum]
MMEPAVAVTGLTRRYGRKTALDGVDLHVEPGGAVGILGANGAGKTTLVETIVGLRRPTAGRVRVRGLDPIRDRARVRSVLGVQLQNAAMHEDLTVAENLRLHRSFYRQGVDPDALIDALGLRQVAGTRAQRLSGGQQQRLSVAAALIGGPRIVILDELTTGLDPEGRHEVWRMIEELREEGVTILLVSHSMTEVERLCDRLVMLERGRIAIEGTPADVIERTRAEDLEEAFLRLRGRGGARSSS